MSYAKINSKTDFDKLTQSCDISVTHFRADFAAECSNMDVVVDVLSTKFPTVKFYSLEAEEFPELSLLHSVIAVPTFIILRRGKPSNRVDGANPTLLTKKIEELLEIPDLSHLIGDNPKPHQKENVVNRIKQLISSAKCMVFMKGSPLEPKCKFSRALVDLFAKYDADYSTFNIFSDEEIRQALKDFSKWPTYPQIFVDGEFIGGIDICKQLDESDELAKLLPVKLSLEKRLKLLVNSQKRMLFMKGSPTQPRCGFSRQIVAVLEGVDYGHFDILLDDEVRQGLKLFSNWPTYPQLYIDGELVGGVDIVKELNESGELKEVLGI